MILTDLVFKIRKAGNGKQGYALFPANISKQIGWKEQEFNVILIPKGESWDAQKIAELDKKRLQMIEIEKEMELLLKE